MKFSRALRGGFVVAAVLLVIMAAKMNSHRYWAWKNETESQDARSVNSTKPQNEPLVNVPTVAPLSIAEDMLMTPFGHVSRLLVDCPNNDTTQCLKFLQNHEPMQIRNTSDELTIFHTAWRGAMVPVHQFLLYSYLATQHLNKTILVYWLEAEDYNNFTSNPMLAPFRDHPNIYFKCFNLSDLAKDTPMDVSRIFDEEQRNAVNKLFGAKGALWGDLVRMLILYKYGGIYVDVDVIFLRPMEVFAQNEFAYLWAAQAGKMNTAVFSLQKRGKSATKLFEHVIGKRNDFHPWKLYEIIIKQNLSVITYPAAYFDPVWNIAEKASEQKDMPFNHFVHFFSKSNQKEFKFWEGAYAYHFHNQYNKLTWDNDSWAGKLFTRLQEQYRNNSNNHDFVGVKPEYADLLVEKCNVKT